ncbi:hypothetical protein CVU82_03580 [Candidatus Falkowbacteria bacterium HGW-Falkowbacteria-1]|uniref:Uncharacterized protein n=1 Tax=Candidatus Falkowbacteria bacterium HGW-Falkowbacteria-1 TaxID=2013768 RepID=A0A2N2E8T8_9BACT|nr:MAG: hypothetical protein CVU82_03580 [Candidatus Falkowbacteria bacterium HGW-Falkowbacteria-1]
MIIVFISLFCGISKANAQKDSIIIESGIVDEKDVVLMYEAMDDHIKNGNLKGATNAAEKLGEMLSSRSLEKIIKTNINKGQAEVAFQAARMNKRNLSFKEILTALKKKNAPIDSISKYINRNITPKEAGKLQKIYIKNGDLKNSENASFISEVFLKEKEYLNIYLICIQEERIDDGILAAKKAGQKGKEALSTLLKRFTNLRDMTTSIKIATAIGGKNLTKREWTTIKKLIPPANEEEIIKFIMAGK